VRRVDGSIAWAALDLVSCLLLVVYTLVAPPRARSARIVTQGAYAVVLQWPRASRDDLDLYVQDRTGQVAWYGQPDTGALQLEHDDLGARTGTSYQFGPNYERTVVRTVTPGTYAAVVHAYCKRDPGPAHASVELWRLGTNQRPLETRDVVLAATGDVQTAFRWKVDAAGDVTGVDHLPVTLAQASGVGCG
jgi:hypothetical protein